ncbi:MAG: hypothetical protein KJN90_13545, partial [Gammaproteobacteria bacterium]|nr:hypothetical protein [Gammaproteobacteria bacterium]
MNLTFDSATNLRLKALLMGLVAPLAILILSLKSLRVLGHRELQSITEALQLYRSDILLLILFFLAGSIVIYTLRYRNQKIALGVLQLAAVLWAAIETIAHQFYVVTGSTIDFGLFLFSVQRLGDTGQVILSEVPGILMLLLALVILMLLLFPWFIVYQSVADEQPRKVGWKPVLAIASLGFVSSPWSIITVDHIDNPGFSRSNLINFAFSMARLGDDVVTGEVI